ncbi:putative gustatory receptor [Trypoxylus dichotomus]
MNQPNNVYAYMCNTLISIPVWVSEDLRSDIKKQRKLPKSTSDSLFIVDTVASYHIKLADIAAILNQAFCVQLLLLITTSFLGIVTALFLIAINFKQPSTDDASSYNFVFTAWAFSNTIALLVVVHTTCALCDEANKCPRILHKIRNNTNDPKLHTTIEMYSLQMYHNRLQFHVCGLFPLDYTLLYTITPSSSSADEIDLGMYRIKSNSCFFAFRRKLASEEEKSFPSLPHFVLPGGVDSAEWGQQMALRSLSGIELIVKRLPCTRRHTRPVKWCCESLEASPVILKERTV